MSLGVLNNLSAVYAENSLNNSNNSLNTTLQQLSSGSKINSGADDAAGLSLVNGLQANQQALTQSETNSAEGVGLLQVADGALSQVTSLLNRAVTLATEASNGTLNSSQDTAANQEYQSILSEISNIGSTTTYNDQAVFGTNTNIYTGDASTAGSAVDALNIRTLSSSNVGDTGGVMAYSNGANNTFIDLSNGAGSPGAIATVNDGFNSATTKLTVNYMATGAGGAAIQESQVISVGNGTNYSDTAQGLINAINGAGLGLTASFTTATQAGTQAVAAAGGAGHSTDTGIEINGPGAGVGNGATPGAVGALAIVGGSAASQTDTLSGTLSLKNAAGANITLTLGQDGTDSTLAELATTLTADGFTVATTNNGTTHAGLTITTQNSVQSAITGSSLTDTASGTLTYTAAAGGYYTTGVQNNLTYGANGGIADVATGQTADATATADTNSAGGTATISYSDLAGQSLSTTDLSSQTDAQAALTSLSAAITDVSAQDGYIGAQINTLNAVSQVLSTQSENVKAAQNAVQATDYASATSNMSKYEILSQTGIAALAQANSVQQEVTKLLQ
ncbi:MAG: flagellin [Terracidiphilus sp.]